MAPLKSRRCRKYWSGNLFFFFFFFAENSPKAVLDLHKTDKTAAFPMLLCSYAHHKDTQTQFADSALITAERREDGSRRHPSLISSSNVPALLITPRDEVQFHCRICMSGVSRGGCRMTSAPADPQSCCHPSSPRSPSWMVWSPSNRGQGSPLVDQRLLGKSIDTPRSNLASALPAWLADYPPPPPPSLPYTSPSSLVMAK